MSAGTMGVRQLNSLVGWLIKSQLLCQLSYAPF
jgi:hypothetical protein